MVKFPIKFLGLLIFFNTSFAFAELNPKVGLEFTYQIQIKSNFSKLFQSLDLFFINKELNPISLPDNFIKTKTTLSTMDRIYSGDLGKTIVFIKGDLLPSREELFNNPIKLDDGFLCHYKVQDGASIAVFVKTNNWQTADEIFSSLKYTMNIVVENTHQNSTMLQKVASQIVDSSYALDTIDCQSNFEYFQKNFNSLSNISQSIINQSSPIQHISSCVLGSISGVWDGSAGLVIGGVKSLSEFIVSPLESGKKYWESTTKLWDVSQKFFKDFENESRKFYAGFDTLDPIVKTKIACQVLGIVGGGILLNYLTAGVLATSTTEILLQKIRNAIKTVLDSNKLSEVKKLLNTRVEILKLVKFKFDKNLLTLSRGSVQEATLANNEVLSGLKNLPIESVSLKRKAGLESNEIQELFRQVYDNPVASLTKVSDYEKNLEGAGYCFGRAMAVHIKALMNGADKNSIRKVWAVGDLQSNGADWRYHVTTIVRDKNGKWMAIDPFMEKVLPIEEWYTAMKKYDSSGNMRIFETEAKQFGPNSEKKYSPKMLENKSYSNYFDDLMESFQAETKELMSKRKATN
jgi:hypothetical protein